MKIFYRALALAAAALTAACAQANAPTTVTPVSALRAASGPPKCAGQRTARKYAALKLTLRKGGGLLCVPEFGGFGGKVAYPGVERPVVLAMRSSVQDIYDEPQLGSGTAIFYLNLHFLAGTHFHKTLHSDGALTSEQIEAGQPYTAYGIVTVGHLAFMFTPCYAVATQGQYGGVLPRIGELFSSATITGDGFGVIEIYSGEQVSQEC